MSARLKVGINDLATKSPDIAKEWDYSRNAPLTPQNVCNSSTLRVWWICERGHSWDAAIDSRTSGRKVWWLCSAGHEWFATISSRAKGSGCPYCSGLKVTPGMNDLATLAPELLNEWDYHLNTDIEPHSVSPHSHKTVWWKCSEGHSWQKMIRKRYLSKKRICPLCKKIRKSGQGNTP